MKIQDYLTTSRIILAPAAMALIISGKTIAAFCIYLIAACTDALDGHFARKNRKAQKKGEIFDSLADFTLVYLAMIALATANKAGWIIAIILVSAAIILCIIGLISIKNKQLTMPHRKSAKAFAVITHTTILAYIAGWAYSGILLAAGIAMGIYTLLDYALYSIKQKTL